MGMTAKSPESPSKQVARTSALVGAETSHRVPGCSHAHHQICSAAVRVFPAPRPASSSQIDHQLPWGSTWWLWASVSHLALLAKAILWVSGAALRACKISGSCKVASRSLIGGLALQLKVLHGSGQDGHGVVLHLKRVLCVTGQDLAVAVLLGVPLCQQL